MNEFIWIWSDRIKYYQWVDFANFHCFTRVVVFLQFFWNIPFQDHFTYFKARLRRNILFAMWTSIVNSHAVFAFNCNFLLFFVCVLSLLWFEGWAHWPFFLSLYYQNNLELIRCDTVFRPDRELRISKNYEDLVKKISNSNVVISSSHLSWSKGQRTFLNLLQT